MKDSKSGIKFYIRRIREGRLKEMWLQTKWIYGYGKHYWLQIILYTLLGLVNIGVSLLSGLVSKDLVDIITGHQTGAVISYFVMMMVYNISSLLLSQLAQYVSTYFKIKVDNEIKAEIFGKILVTDWESLTSYHTGDLLTRWSSDASVVSSGILSFIPDMIIYFARFVAAFAMVIYFDPSFAFFAFLGLPISFILSRTLLRKMVGNNEKSAAMNAKMSGFNQEAFSNIQMIKSFDLAKLYIERLKSIQKEYLGMRLSFQRMSIISSVLFSTIGLLVSYSSYGWGIYRVWSGAISYGTMTMFLGLSGSLTGSLNSLTSLVPTVISLTTSAGRLMDIVGMPQEDYSNDDKALEFLNKYKDEGISLKIDEIDFKYKTGVENVFESASLIARPHETVALVGPSGEGKTTMLRILLSLIFAQNGESVLFNGSDEEKCKEKIKLDPSARKMFSYVPQGNSMISGTIAYNMRMVKPDATDEEIVEALKMACAWDFVEKLPKGIESEIKERGGGFSEGQAQRLSIARALIRKSPILLLDEATSALDVKTERKLLKNIMKDDYPRTLIVTTHRPTVLTICNRVYEIKDKKLTVLDDIEIDKLIRDF